VVRTALGFTRFGPASQRPHWTKRQSSNAATCPAGRPLERWASRIHEPGVAAPARPASTSAPSRSHEAFGIDEANLDRCCGARQLQVVVRIDGNANEMVCVKLSTGDETNNRPFGEFIYNVVDDTARVPG
jgi:hypothetical protein